MTLNDSMQAAMARVQAEQGRLNALQRLKDAGLEFDPRGIDHLTLWMASVGDDPAEIAVRPVHAVRTLGTEGGWYWFGLGEARQAHWSQLIKEVTEGGRYVQAVTKPTGYETVTLTTTPFDPRDQSHG